MGSSKEADDAAVLHFGGKCLPKLCRHGHCAGGGGHGGSDGDGRCRCDFCWFPAGTVFVRRGNVCLMLPFILNGDLHDLLKCTVFVCCGAVGLKMRQNLMYHKE